MRTENHPQGKNTQNAKPLKLQLRESNKRT